jgi:NAD-dependent SIR2 family protein deacetylase
VPRDRVECANEGLALADAVLVVGSSLMIYSGYRFITAAGRARIPVAAINLGKTRADAMFSVKVEAPCADTLAELLPMLPALGLADALPPT